jgi:hypothetical protein
MQRIEHPHVPDIPWPAPYFRRKRERAARKDNKHVIEMNGVRWRASVGVQYATPSLHLMVSAPEVRDDADPQGEMRC